MYLLIFLVELVSFAVQLQTYVSSLHASRIAIPRISDGFNSIQDIGWYDSAYMLIGACFNPISGHTYQL